MNRAESTPVVRWPRAGRYGRQLGPLWGPVRRRGISALGVLMVALMPVIGRAQETDATQEESRTDFRARTEQVERFDTNVEGWLNAGERAAARERLAAGSTLGRGGMRPADGTSARPGRPGPAGRFGAMRLGRAEGMLPRPEGAGPGMRGGRRMMPGNGPMGGIDSPWESATRILRGTPGPADAQ